MEEGTGNLMGKNLDILDLTVSDLDSAPSSVNVYPGKRNQGTQVDEDESVGSSPDKRPSQRKKRKQTHPVKPRDGRSDLSGKISRDSQPKDGASSSEDESVGSSPDKRPSQRKKRKQTQPVKPRDRRSDLSGKISRDSQPKDGASSSEDESVGSSPDKRPSQRKKRKQTHPVKPRDGRSDLSGKISRDSQPKDGASSSEDESVGSSPDKRPSQRKRRKQTHPMKLRDGRSDLSGKISHDSQPKDGASSSEDESVGSSPNKRPSQRKKRKQTQPVKPRVKARRGWSEAERRAVHKHLAMFLKQGRVPRKEACMDCIQKEKILGERSWKDVKNFVYNQIVTLNRRSASRVLKS